MRPGWIEILVEKTLSKLDSDGPVEPNKLVSFMAKKLNRTESEIRDIFWGMIADKLLDNVDGKLRLTQLGKLRTISNHFAAVRRGDSIAVGVTFEGDCGHFWTGLHDFGKIGCDCGKFEGEKGYKKVVIENTDHWTSFEAKSCSYWGKTIEI